VIEIGEQAKVTPSVGSGRRPTDDPDYVALFAREVGPMTRLATLLGADDPENLVQEAFLRLHRKWSTVKDPQAATGYLRTIVVNLARSGHRHLRVVRRHTPALVRDAPLAEDTATRWAEHADVLQALDGLGNRHREALILRYWLDLSEAEMAAAMGISPGTVKSHVSRGLVALRAAIDTLNMDGAGNE